MTEPRLREIPGRGWFAHLADWERDERADFYAAGGSEGEARLELVAAVEAWREERVERVHYADNHSAEFWKNSSESC